MHIRNSRIVFPSDQINRSCKSRISSSPAESNPARKMQVRGCANILHTQGGAQRTHHLRKPSSRQPGGGQHLPCLPWSGELAAVQLERTVEASTRDPAAARYPRPAARSAGRPQIRRGGGDGGSGRPAEVEGREVTHEGGARARARGRGRGGLRSEYT
jgi:hypothetical protein